MLKIEFENARNASRKPSETGFQKAGRRCPGGGGKALHPALLVSTALALFCAPAHGQTAWTGTSSTNWSDPGNWTSGVPTAADDVLINDAALDPVIDGVGATAGSIGIGYPGTGQLTVTNGGALNSGTISLGGQAGNGTLIVTGAGSDVTSSGELYVGISGNGTMHIESGANVSNTTGYVAHDEGTVGHVIVDGAGSTWTNTDALFVGFVGTGSLAVTDGGAVNSLNGVVGYLGDHGSGTVSVSGVGSTWTVGDELLIGSLGVGVMGISDFGTVISPNAYIGYGAGSQGSVGVAGTNAAWETTVLSVGEEGTGSLTIADSGLVTATGGITIASQAGSVGVLNIGAGAGEAAAATGTLATPTLNFGAGDGALVFNHTSDHYAFEVAVSGAGSIGQYAGLTEFTGDSSAFSGIADVHGGTLRVNGMLGGTTNVLAGGTLMGEGTMGDVFIASSGRFAPGNSIGTLNVANIGFAQGSIYEVEITSAGNADLVSATGAATIQGGTVQVLAENGTDDGSTYAPNMQYTIVTAAGGVTNTFDEVTENFAFLTATLEYDPNNVYLVLAQDDTGFCLAGASANQCATGEGVETLGAGNVIYDNVVGLTEDEALAAFDVLSGEIHASAKTALLEDSRFVREAALKRARLGLAEPAAGEGNFLWGEMFRSAGSWSSDGNAATLDRSIGGFFVGADGFATDSLRLGLVTGYSGSDFDADARSSSGSAESFHLGAYGGAEFGAMELRFGGAHAWHTIETQRGVAFGGFADQLSAAYGAATAQVFGEAGYRFDTAIARFEPFVGLAHVHVNGAGFTENGGAAALSVAGGSTGTTLATLGLRAEHAIDLGGMKGTLNGMVGWRHAFGDAVPASLHEFTAGGDAFTIAGAPVARDAAIVDLGLDLSLSPTATLGVAYGGRYGSGMSDHGAKFDLSVQF